MYKFSCILYTLLSLIACGREKGADKTDKWFVGQWTNEIGETIQLSENSMFLGSWHGILEYTYVYYLRGFAKDGNVVTCNLFSEETADEFDLENTIAHVDLDPQSQTLKLYDPWHGELMYTFYQDLPQERLMWLFYQIPNEYRWGEVEHNAFSAHFRKLIDNAYNSAGAVELEEEEDEPEYDLVYWYGGDGGVFTKNAQKSFVQINRSENKAVFRVHLDEIFYYIFNGKEEQYEMHESHIMTLIKENGQWVIDDWSEKARNFQGYLR